MLVLSVHQATNFLLSAPAGEEFSFWREVSPLTLLLYHFNNVIYIQTVNS